MEVCGGERDKELEEVGNEREMREMEGRQWCSEEGMAWKA